MSQGDGLEINSSLVTVVVYPWYWTHQCARRMTESRRAGSENPESHLPCGILRRRRVPQALTADECIRRCDRRGCLIEKSRAPRRCSADDHIVAFECRPQSGSVLRPSSSESPDPEQSGHGERQSTPRDGDECAHLHLEQDWPQRHHGRRQEQGKDEPNGGGASDHQEFTPGDAPREMQACGARHAGSRDDTYRSSERGNGDRPHATLETVKRDAGIDQPEQQKHAFHGKAPPALEKRQRVVSQRCRLDKQASITSPVRKKRNDWHQRERGMHAAHEQRPPGQRARTEQGTAKSS